MVCSLSLPSGIPDFQLLGTWKTICAAPHGRWDAAVGKVLRSKETGEVEQAPRAAGCSYSRCVEAVDEAYQQTPSPQYGESSVRIMQQLASKEMSNRRD